MINNHCNERIVQGVGGGGGRAGLWHGSRMEKNIVSWITDIEISFSGIKKICK